MILVITETSLSVNIIQTCIHFYLEFNTSCNRSQLWKGQFLHKSCASVSKEGWKQTLFMTEVVLTKHKHVISIKSNYIEQNVRTLVNIGLNTIYMFA